MGFQGTMGVEWIHLAQEKNKPWVPENGENFFPAIRFTELPKYSDLW